MKLRLDRDGIVFKLSMDEAAKLLDGTKMEESLTCGKNKTIAWSAVAKPVNAPAASGLDICLPSQFLMQEMSAKRPSKNGLSFTSGDNTITVQIDMRKSVSRDI